MYKRNWTGKGDNLSTQREDWDGEGVNLSTRREDKKGGMGRGFMHTESRAEATRVTKTKQSPSRSTAGSEIISLIPYLVITFVSRLRIVVLFRTFRPLMSF